MVAPKEIPLKVTRSLHILCSMKIKPGTDILTPDQFCVLLALACGVKHGYDIVKQIAHDSCGRVIIERGNLYATMKRLLKARVIEEVVQPSHKLDNDRRRYYQLTKLGRTRLLRELERYAKAISLARAREL